MTYSSGSFANPKLLTMLLLPLLVFVVVGLYALSSSGGGDDSVSLSSFFDLLPKLFKYLGKGGVNKEQTTNKQTNKQTNTKR